MTVKRFLMLLCVLLIIPACACAVVTVPDGIGEVGSEAFAGTAADALIIPASVRTVGANVLAGCDASYIWLEGASTALESGANNDVPFVFGPAASPASGLEGFYPTENLVTDSGLYYHVAQTALPLCARAPASLTGSVTIPKLLGGVPVTSLEVLYLANTGVTELLVPRYLTIPAGLTAKSYQSMYVDAPLPGVMEIPAGKYVTWTAERPAEAYGDVTYTWRFNVNGATSTVTTTEPTVKFAPMAEGTCKVTLTVQDSLGDWANATSAEITVTAAQPVYRALLVGNTYAGSGSPLKGPDNDVAGMVVMLNSMPGTRFRITTSTNLHATGIQSAIASTFAGAEPGDVSLFYYSGHGTETGALVGTNNTYLTVYALRTSLQKIPGTKIVILDCCYSGAAINKSAGSQEDVNLNAFNRAIISGLTSQSRSSGNLAADSSGTSTASSENLASGGYIVLTACRKDQESLSLTGDGSYYWGVFTYGVCYGSGYDLWQRTSLGRLPADANGDGAISLGEAYQGVRERVSYLNGIAYVEQVVQYHGDTSFILWKK